MQLFSLFFFEVSEIFPVHVPASGQNYPQCRPAASRATPAVRATLTAIIIIIIFRYRSHRQVFPRGSGASSGLQNRYSLGSYGSLTHNCQCLAARGRGPQALPFTYCYRIDGFSHCRRANVWLDQGPPNSPPLLCLCCVEGERERITPPLRIP